MKISWKYAKVLLQFQNGVGPRDSSNIMLRSQKNVAAVCCAFHIHTDLKSGSKFAATALNKKNAKIDGAPDWHIDSYGGTSVPSTSDVGIKSVPRKKNWLWRWLTVFDKHMILQHMISARQAQGAFWQVAKNKFCHLHIADWLPLSWDDLRSETCLFVKKSVFRYKDIFPQRTSTWFLWLLVLELYYSYSCGSCFYWCGGRGISTLHERVLSNVRSIRGLLALNLIVVW